MSLVLLNDYLFKESDFDILHPLTERALKGNSTCRGKGACGNSVEDCFTQTVKECGKCTARMGDIKKTRGQKDMGGGGHTRRTLVGFWFAQLHGWGSGVWF